MAHNEKEREIYTHPSYGMIQFSRVNCGGKGPKFFGSELNNDTYIQMTVSDGELNRDLSKDWYYAGRTPLLQVRMTQMQFSELITSLNMGSGVPCTVEIVKGEQIEQEKEFESKKEATHRQFKDRLTFFSKSLKETQAKAKQLVKKKTLSKEDQHELDLHLNWLTTEIEKNIPFFMECFQETMDKVVVDAKQEIEAAIMHKVTTLGLEKLHEQNSFLLNDKDK